MQLLKNYCVNINFEEEYFETKVNNLKQKHLYPGTDGKEATVMSIRTAKHPSAEKTIGDVGKKEFYDRPDFMAEMCKRFPGSSDVYSYRVNYCRDDSQKYGLNWHEGDIRSHSDHVRHSSGDTECFYALDALIDAESVEDADLIGDKEIGDSIGKCNMIPVSGHIFHAERDGAYKPKTSCSMLRRPSSQHDITIKAPRDIAAEGLKLKTVEAESLSSKQQVELFNMLMKYKDSFSSRPGKCHEYVYSFEVNDREDIGTSREIPFKLRNEVREKIQQLLEDNIIGHSNSSYINPLTIVTTPGKVPRICFDARRVNRDMTPDRPKIPPIQELIQRFYGSKFIMSITITKKSAGSLLHSFLRMKCISLHVFLSG
jgi:hypothetical protein